MISQNTHIAEPSQTKPQTKRNDENPCTRAETGSPRTHLIILLLIQVHASCCAAPRALLSRILQGGGGGVGLAWFGLALALVWGLVLVLVCLWFGLGLALVWRWFGLAGFGLGWAVVWLWLCQPRPELSDPRQWCGLIVVKLFAYVAQGQCPHLFQWAQTAGRTTAAMGAQLCLVHGRPGPWHAVL